MQSMNIGLHFTEKTALIFTRIGGISNPKGVKVSCLYLGCYSFVSGW